MKTVYFVLIMLLFAAQPGRAEVSYTRYTVFDYDPATLQMKPAKPFPPEHFTRVENRFGLDFFGHITTDFGNPDNQQFSSQRLIHSVYETYRTQEKCDDLLMGGQDPTKSRENNMVMAMMNAITKGQPGRILSRQALNTMESRDYISDEEYNEYFDSDESLGKHQSVEISTVGWLTVQQFVDIFPDGIPWHLLAEVQVPADENKISLREVLRDPRSKARVLVRRATLRLLASIFFDDNATVEYGYLPWEFTPGMQPRNRGQIPMAFEFSRGSQLYGVNQEAFQLTQMAALLALQRSRLIDVIGRTEGFHPSEIGVFAHSLSPVNSKLYDMKLGFGVSQLVEKPATETERAKYHAIVMENLEELIVKTKAWRVDKTLTRMLEIAMEGDESQYHVENILRLMEQRSIYRNYRRGSWDLTMNGNSQLITGLTVRMSKANAARLLKRRYTTKDPGMISRSDKVIDLLMAEDDFDYTDAFLGWGRDAVFNNHIKPPEDCLGVMSGFGPAKTDDTQLIAKIVLGIRKEISHVVLQNRGLIIVSGIEKYEKQARALGLPEVDFGPGKPKGYSINAQFLDSHKEQLDAIAHQLSPKNPNGFSTMPNGHFYKQWMWMTHPGL